MLWKEATSRQLLRLPMHRGSPGPVGCPEQPTCCDGDVLDLRGELYGTALPRHRPPVPSVADGHDARVPAGRDGLE